MEPNQIKDKSLESKHGIYSLILAILSLLFFVPPIPYISSISGSLILFFVETGFAIIFGIEGLNTKYRKQAIVGIVISVISLCFLSYIGSQISNSFERMF